MRPAGAISYEPNRRGITPKVLPLQRLLLPTTSLLLSPRTMSREDKQNHHADGILKEKRDKKKKKSSSKEKGSSGSKEKSKSKSKSSSKKHNETLGRKTEVIDLEAGFPLPEAAPLSTLEKVRAASPNRKKLGLMPETLSQQRLADKRVPWYKGPLIVPLIVVGVMLLFAIGISALIITYN